MSRSVGDVITPLGWDIEMLEEGCVAAIIASWFVDELNWSVLNGGGMMYPKCILVSEDIEDCAVDIEDCAAEDCAVDCGDSKDGLVVLDLAGSVEDSGEPTAMGMSPSLSYIFIMASMRLG